MIIPKQRKDALAEAVTPCLRSLNTVFIMNAVTGFLHVFCPAVSVRRDVIPAFYILTNCADLRNCADFGANRAL
ncbi:MAG: hypothetical protein K5770_09030, partial [Lachnospiraceae bacterium]|nr:hypothetical protein [Lachnospiraceae bacterium]